MSYSIDAELIKLELDFGTPANQIAVLVGEPLLMVIHGLAIRGCPELSCRLAQAAHSEVSP